MIPSAMSHHKGWCLGLLCRANLILHNVIGLLMSMTEVDEYRTNDMAMATFLRVEGHTVQDITWKYDTCYWVFLMTRGLLESVALFESGEAVVEPKTYSKNFMRTKREFYDSRPAPARRRR